MSRKDVSNIQVQQPKKSDVTHKQHEDFIAGIPPYLRGTSPTMYLEKPWIIHQESLKKSANSNQKEALKTPEIEIAYALSEGLEQLQKNVKKGINIDAIAPKITFSFEVGMNHFEEIAKIRTARMLWAKIVQQFNPKDAKSSILNLHCETKNTSNFSLIDDQPFNNITRTTIQAMATAFGGTQSLHTHSFDQTTALPNDFSARIARNTQLFLQEETHITKTIDPWAGSYHLEKLTEDIAHKAWKLITEIQELGGINKVKK